MNSLLKLIKDSPLSYLPRESLRSLAHFREGYRSRCNMEGAPYEWQYDHWEFRAWLCRHFQMSSEASIHDIGIIELFSTSEADAFHRHFALLAEFLSTADGAKEEGAMSLVDSKIERRDFAEMAKAIRHCPAMYLGSASFLGFSSYLMGDERAQLDLGFAVDEGRAIFRDFQKWVEIEQNNFKLHRPWFKIIEFWSAGSDCGHTSSGAYTLFFKWLDRYTEQIGKPGLFGPIPPTAAGPISRQIH
jgi:hypothetical protein